MLRWRGSTQFGAMCDPLVHNCSDVGPHPGFGKSQIRPQMLGNTPSDFDPVFRAFLGDPLWNLFRVGHSTCPTLNLLPEHTHLTCPPLAILPYCSNNFGHSCWMNLAFATMSLGASGWGSRQEDDLRSATRRMANKETRAPGPQGRLRHVALC